MNSPIKTIIKNKSDRLFFCNMYPRYQIALKPCGEDGDTVELCGDIFTMMRTRQEMQGLMRSVANGTIDITFGIDEIFKTLKLDYNSTLKLVELNSKQEAASKAVADLDTELEKPAKSTEAEQKVVSQKATEPETKTNEPEQQTEQQAEQQDEQVTESVPAQEDTATKSGNRRRSKNVKLG